MLFLSKSVRLHSEHEEDTGLDDGLPGGGLQAPGIMDANRVKRLPPSVVKDIEQKNVARRLAGLSPIVIKVRRCISCGSKFESAGNRTCGCSSRTAGTIAGREII